MAPTIIAEKEGLLPSAISQKHPEARSILNVLRTIFYLLVSLVATCAILSLWALPGVLRVWDDEPLYIADLCPQPAALSPLKYESLWNDLNEAYKTEAFLNRSVSWLGGAVRVQTESYDKMGPVGNDTRWEAFGAFHGYLQTAFPNVHAALTLTKVNTYGLVYEWTGSDSSLKPLLLAAHQDVVPVNPETVNEWVHPPYSGHFDGKRLWGRGTSDDKCGLIGILSSLEMLLVNGFKPTRSIVLAFGFDEETSGIHGAATLAVYLEKTYGENAFFMLVDEGGDYMNEYGQAFATPGIAEKGALDIRVEVESPGGHSSVPPPHTTIGILSSLLVQLEANPYVPRLGRGTPMYMKAQCLASHAPDLPSSLRKALQNSITSDKALREAESILFQDPMFKALVQTTQAIDLIQGGVKANALPESASAVVDYRIATDSSVDAVQERGTKLLANLATKFNLSYEAFGKNVNPEKTNTYGNLKLSDAWGTALAPAPITPTGLGDKAAPFQLLAGTIRTTNKVHRGGNVVVSPAIMSGNTDTRYYWKLTDHIFRYNHHYTGNNTIYGVVHTVNEFIEMDAYIEMVTFFTTLILNSDEAIVI